MTNTLKGNDFEERSKNILENYLKENLEVQKKIEIGYELKKSHKFDLGNSNYLIECKAYNWTAQGNIPSAKISTLRETLYYFSFVSEKYIKILALKKSNLKNGETVLDYFLRLNFNLIPSDLKLLEIDTINGTVEEKNIKEI